MIISFPISLFFGVLSVYFLGLAGLFFCMVQIKRLLS